MDKQNILNSVDTALYRQYQAYYEEENRMNNDAINHPQHYIGNVETIDYIQDKLTHEGFEGYLTGNCLKYLSRYKKKNGVEDIKKCQKYIEFLINFLEKGSAEIK